MKKALAKNTDDLHFFLGIVHNFASEDAGILVQVWRHCTSVASWKLKGKTWPRREIFRGRFRKSFETPSAFVPGKVEQVKFELPSLAHAFKKGHRIMVQIQSSWFPLADRNPQQFIDIYNCSNKDFVKSNIKVYHNSQYVSKIVLPVLK